MAMVLMTIIKNIQGCTFLWRILILIVQAKSHITLCGKLIARDYTGFTFMLLLLVSQENFYNKTKLER